MRQGWSGTGYFVEDKESLGANPLKSAEQKKLLSAVEKSGLLSRAEKAGLTLTRVRHHIRLLLVTEILSELISGTSARACRALRQGLHLQPVAALFCHEAPGVSLLLQRGLTQGRGSTALA